MQTAPLVEEGVALPPLAYLAPHRSKIEQPVFAWAKSTQK